MDRLFFSLGIALLVMTCVSLSPGSASFLSTFAKYLSKGNFRPVDNFHDGLIQLRDLLIEAESRGRQKVFRCGGGSQLTLQCPVGMAIQVVSASVTPVTETRCNPKVTGLSTATVEECSSTETVDETSKVAPICDGHNHCKHSMWGDNCRYAEIEFICNKAGSTPGLHTAYVCRNDQLLLQCDWGQHIRVHRANWGYPAEGNGRCGSPSSANDGCTNDRTHALANLCNGQRFFHNYLMGPLYSPILCNDTAYLEVDFSCEKPHKGQTCGNNDLWEQQEDLDDDDVFGHFSVLYWIRILMMKVQEVIDQLPAHALWCAGRSRCRSESGPGFHHGTTA